MGMSTPQISQKNHSILYNAALLILLLFTANLLFVTLMFFFDVTISSITFPLSVLIAVIMFFWIRKFRFTREHIVSVIVFLAIIIVVIWCCGQLYGPDYDGNMYHKAIVGQFANGWNPLKESGDAVMKRIFGDNPNIDSQSLWGDHYAKASWIFAGSIYSLTGSIEYGKAYTLLAIISFFIFFYEYLKTKHLKKWQAFIVSSITAFNPISVVTCMTYYVDGFLWVMLFTLILALTEDFSNPDRQANRDPLIIAGCSMIVLGNIKFTGLLYGGIYCIFYYLFFCIHEYRTDKTSWKYKAVRRFGYFATVALITCCWAGYCTYITNLIDHGSATYPLTGEGHVDIMSAAYPGSFKNMNNIEKLFYSLFSRVNNLIASDTQLPILKIPFTVYPEELTMMTSISLRISGNGIFYSGILLVSLVIDFFNIRRLRKNNRVAYHLVMMYALIIVALSLIISESWWARHSPYQYLIVTFALASMFQMWNSRKPKFKLISAVAMIAFVGINYVNNGLFFLVLVQEINETPVIKEQFKEMKNCSNGIEIVQRFNFDGMLFDLKDQGIDFTVLDKNTDTSDMTPAYFHYFYWREKEQ